jgi:hypothetical protein
MTLTRAFLEEHIAAGLSQREIAELAGVSRTLIANVLARYGLATVNPPGVHGSHLAYLTDDWLRAHADDNARELADALGMHESSVRAEYRRRGIPRHQARKTWTQQFIDCKRCAQRELCQAQTRAGGRCCCEHEAEDELEKLCERERQEARG